MTDTQVFKARYLAAQQEPPTMRISPNCMPFSDYFIKNDRLYVFTGKKDKNGTKIYSGQLIKYVEKTNEHGDSHQLVGRVAFDCDSAAFCIVGPDAGCVEVWNLFTDYGIYDLEVIE